MTHKGKVVRAGISNLKRLKKMKRRIELPEISEGKRMWNAAKALGFTKSTDMGGTLPIPLSEILHAVHVEGSPIRNWHEAVITSEICQAYALGLADGRDPLGKPPWERNI